MKWGNYMENTNETTRENEGSWSKQEPCGQQEGCGCALGQRAGSRGRRAKVHSESREGDKIPTVTDRSSSWRQAVACQRRGGRDQRRWTQKFRGYYKLLFFFFSLTS